MHTWLIEKWKKSWKKNRVVFLRISVFYYFFFPSAENVCKGHGDVVNILLNQEKSTATLPDGKQVTMVTDSYFQMNYQTGLWQTVKKIHPEGS